MNKESYRNSLEIVRNIFVEIDPMGLIELDAPADEYDSEVSGLLPLLRKCTSQHDVEIVISGLCAKKFGESAVPRSIIAELGRRIFGALKEAGWPSFQSESS